MCITINLPATITRINGNGIIRGRGLHYPGLNLGGGGGGGGGVLGGLWLGAWGVALQARQSHQEQQAVHGWQRGLKHVQYAIPLAGQQCKRVHLFVRNPQHPQEPWYAPQDFAFHATHCCPTTQDGIGDEKYGDSGLYPGIWWL